MGRYERVLRFGLVEERVSTDMLIPAVLDAVGNFFVKAGLGIAVVVFSFFCLSCKVLKTLDDATSNER